MGLGLGLGLGLATCTMLHRDGEKSRSSSEISVESWKLWNFKSPEE